MKAHLATGGSPACFSVVDAAENPEIPPVLCYTTAQRVKKEYRPKRKEIPTGLG